MKWMRFAADGRAGIRPFAGLYLRTPNRTRFWGWGQPPLATIAPPPAAEQPFAAVGDWLRAAHSLFGPERPQEAQIQEPAVPRADSPSSASQKMPGTFAAEESGTGPERKRRLRFVCNRRVIGFVFD